ncbi:aldehyde dehydrogenase family protein [Streptomyces sp. NPDC060209]|uniref:aldehyde dehydrogenase family protein n=1 Tax=Streptomyces sp. NPDC060209 TaxID=3347073 RepID=UPI00364B3D0F
MPVSALRATRCIRGTGAAIVARQGAAAFRAARWLRAGNVGVNATSRNVEASIRGSRNSGVCRGVSSYALHTYGELHPIAEPG